MSSTVLQQSPIDSTKKEHFGLIERVRFRNEKVAILELTDGKIVKVFGETPAFHRGIMYRFFGYWDRGDDRYPGWSFLASSFSVDRPLGRDGVVAHLIEVCDGIGKKTAMKLFDVYGADCVRVLREEPDKIFVDGHLDQHTARNASRNLQRYKKIEKTKIELNELLGGRGFGGRAIDAAIALWGVSASDRIRTCPFRMLLRGVPGAGFKRCDKLHMELGLNSAALKRQVIAGWHELAVSRSGSTWHPVATVGDAIRKTVPSGEANPIKAIKLGLRARMFAIIREPSQKWIAIGSQARAERRVADSLRRLLESSSVWPTDITVSEIEGDGLPSSHQVEQLRLATSAAVGCFTGSPGTGKTFTLSYLIRRIIEKYGIDSISVACPTGKAAIRATESLRRLGIGLRAVTIHRLLEVDHTARGRGDGWAFVHNRDNPLPIKFLIIDEASMCDTTLMADLLDACTPGTHVLFVGDPGQLAPVGHGCPFIDVIRSNMVGVGQLTEIRRNAGLIVRGCRSIREGKRVEFAPRLDLKAADPANLLFVDCPVNRIMERIESFLGSMRQYDKVWDCQILTPTNDKGVNSRNAINQRLAPQLNPTGRKSAGIPFRVGDKIICLRNSRVDQAQIDDLSCDDADRCGPDRDNPDMIANGEIGRVQAVGSRGMVVRFSDAMDQPSRFIWVPKSRKKNNETDESTEGETETDDASGAMGDWVHAYAITGHKSQGSQWPIVIIIADPVGASVADRNWWDTTTSRAEKATIIFGDRAAFERQCGRLTIDKRKTFLVETLKDPHFGGLQ